MTDRWAVIPARGGSKSIPKKNLVPVAGQPLIAYVTTTAVMSGVFTRIICSTDDRDIAREAAKYGADIHWRDSQASRDTSPVEDAIISVVGTAKSPPEWIYVLQPTSPLLRVSDIQSATQQEVRGVNSIQTVSRIPHLLHSWNQRVIDEQGNVTFLHPDKRLEGYQKQKKPATYSFGNLVAVRGTALVEQGTLWARPSRGVIIDSYYSLDVDIPEDLPEAERRLSAELQVPPGTH